MSSPPSPAARRVLALWEGVPRLARRRVAARWRRSPYEALELEVPLAGDILEIGCGPGVLSAYLAVTSRARRVVGVDADGGAIAVANRAVAQLDPSDGDVSFRVSPPGVVPRRDGGWCCIVVADRVHRLAPQDRDALLVACVDALAPGGLLVVAGPRRVGVVRAGWQRLLGGFARRSGGPAGPAGPAGPRGGQGDRAELDRLGVRTLEKRVDPGRLHPYFVVLGTKPTEPVAG